MSRVPWIKERKSHERKNDVAVFLRVEGGALEEREREEGALTHQAHLENESKVGAGHSRGPDLQHSPPSQIRTPHRVQPAKIRQTVQCQSLTSPYPAPRLAPLSGFDSRVSEAGIAILATPLLP